MDKATMSLNRRTISKIIWLVLDSAMQLYRGRRYGVQEDSSRVRRSVWVGSSDQCLTSRVAVAWQASPRPSPSCSPPPPLMSSLPKLRPLLRLRRPFARTKRFLSATSGDPWLALTPAHHPPTPTPLPAALAELYPTTKDEPPRLLRRPVDERLDAALRASPPAPLTLVTGPRGAGKSTALLGAVARIRGRGGLVLDAGSATTWTGGPGFFSPSPVAGLLERPTQVVASLAGFAASHGSALEGLSLAVEPADGGLRNVGGIAGGGTGGSAAAGRRPVQVATLGELVAAALEYAAPLESGADWDWREGPGVLGAVWTTVARELGAHAAAGGDAWVVADDWDATVGLTEHVNSRGRVTTAAVLRGVAQVLCPTRVRWGVAAPADTLPMAAAPPAAPLLGAVGLAGGGRTARPSRVVDASGGRGGGGGGGRPEWAAWLSAAVSDGRVATVDAGAWREADVAALLAEWRRCGMMVREGGKGGVLGGGDPREASYLATLGGGDAHVLRKMCRVL